MPGELYRREQVAGRNTKDEAALVIDNVVYDVTEFLIEHPGGGHVLLDRAGGDASQCFHDVGHSEYARDWMKSFAIGEVVEEERREVLPWPPSVIDEEPERVAAGFSLRGVLDACSAPLALAALAVSFYFYMLAPEEAP